MGTVEWGVNQPPPNRIAFVQEPEIGSWQNNPTWGQRYQNPMPPGPGMLLPIFSRDRFPGPPRVQTVQLFRSDVVLDDTANSDVRARVSYGIGGVNNTFDVDWIQGAQFSLVCSNVRVDAVSVAPDAANDYAAGGNIITLAAGVAEKPSAHGAPNTWSSQWYRLRANIANDDRVTVPVPDFARAFRVNFAANAYPSIVATAVLETTTIVHGASFGYYPQSVFQSIEWVPLSLGVRAVHVLNATPAIANPTDVQVVFQLGI